MSRLDSDVKVRNPRTGKVDRDLAAPTSEELTALIAKLRGAQKNWESLGAIKRGEILMQ